MFSNLSHIINQKWNEFFYRRFCLWIKNLFSDDDHIVIESNKPQHPVQNKEVDPQERFKTAKENHLIFLSFIGYSFNQFVSHFPDENLRKELIEHYEKEVLPTLAGNSKRKMEEFINDYKNDGWKIVDHDDCPSPDEKFDMSKGRIVEEPSKEMKNANITAHNPETLFLRRCPRG